MTEVTDDLIPTGKLLPVAGGPLDFTSGKKLGADMFSEDHLIALCGGFDHNFCVDGTGFRKFASLGTGERTRNGSVFRSPPACSSITFNRAGGLMGKDGNPMRPHTSFCLETQFILTRSIIRNFLSHF